jgi:hypothetical protein
VRLLQLCIPLSTPISPDKRRPVGFATRLEVIHAFDHSCFFSAKSELRPAVYGEVALAIARGLPAPSLSTPARSKVVPRSASGGGGKIMVETLDISFSERCRWQERMKAVADDMQLVE